MYIIAGLAVVAVAAVAIVGSGGEIFQGRLGNLNFNASRSQPTAPAASSNTQAAKINPSSVGSVITSTEPKLMALPTNDTYKNGGKHLNLLNFRITAGAEQLNLQHNNTTISIYLEKNGKSINKDFSSDSIKWNNCTLDQGGTTYKASSDNAYYMGIPGNWGVNFWMNLAPIKPYQSMDFSLYCNVTAKSGDSIDAGVWNIIDINLGNILGHFASNESGKRAQGPLFYVQ